MKPYRQIWSIVFILCAVATHSETIKGIVVWGAGDDPVQGADISICQSDSLIQKLCTGPSGQFKISLEEGIYNFRIWKEGYKSVEKRVIVSGSEVSEELRCQLEPAAVMLDEVVVKANPIYVRKLDDGIIYNLSRDRYAQKDNLLNALNRVPLLMVDSDGTINVAGKNKFLIYLNGKPYSIANANPAQVLRSISSSNIKQIEVITKPSQRFGENIPVINIITKSNSIEGYHINFLGSGATTPKAKGASSVLAAINKVQFFAGYTYDLWGQRNQRWDHKYYYSNGIYTTSKSDYNRKNRHTHQGRAMIQWDMDTLSQLYADFYINGIKRNEKIHYDQFQSATNITTPYLSVSDTWDASMEANIIYSNKFKTNNSQKWRIGYRFTLNPDNRDYKIEDCTNDLISMSKTKGRLYTHNVQIFRNVQLSEKLLSFFTLNGNLRHGASTSAYAISTAMDNTEGFSYTQILGSLTWDLIWYLTESKDLRLNATNKIEYVYDKITDLESHSHSISYLPTLKFIWQPDWSNELELAFSSTVNRPSLQMLNPFIGGIVENDVMQGSPNLKDARAYSLSLGYSFYGERVIISPTISGRLTRNSIMSVFDTDLSSAQVIETYSNIPRVEDLSLELYLSYRPWQWLTLRNVSSLGLQNIVWHSKSLSQSDGFYQSTSVMSLRLPASLQFEASFTLYKNRSKAWLHYEPGALYGFSLSKTLMDGNFYIKLFADSPFDRHGVMDSRTNLSSPNLSYTKLWEIHTRSVGIEISINLRGGKKVGLKRNTSLKDSDIRSGIDN